MIRQTYTTDPEVAMEAARARYNSHKLPSDPEFDQLPDKARHGLRDNLQLSAQLYLNELKVTHQRSKKEESHD